LYLNSVRPVADIGEGILNMESIATLIQHDPYFDVPLCERTAARRERRARMWPAPKVVPAAPEPQPALLLRGDPPDYRVMWFYNLVFETELKLPLILAQRAGCPQVIRIEQIQVACARYYGVTRAEIISARRHVAIVRPRQVGYYLSKALTLKSLPEIGRRFGKRDHSSILHGVRKIGLLRKTDVRLDAELHSIAASVGGSLA
jgi:hypothetical protein